MYDELILPIHPTTGIRAVYVNRNGRAFYPIAGGAPEGDEGGEGGDGGAGGKPGSGGTGGEGGDGGSGDGDDGDKDLGFPKETPVAEMSDKEQAAYWRHHAKQHESRAKGLSKLTGGRTAEQIKADNEELERLRTGQMTDQQKAVKEAEDKARAEERGKAGQRIAKATFEGALAHLEKKDREEILDGLDLKKYVDADGEVDTDKVRDYAAKIAPVDKTTTPPKQKRDWGGGRRPEPQGKKGQSSSTDTDEPAPRRWGK